MTLGAEPKKVAILGLLVAVAGVMFYTQVLEGPGDEPAPRSAAVNTAAPSPVAVAPAAVQRARSTGRRRGGILAGEWSPRVGPADPKDRPDPATIDPRIRFDLLDTLAKVEVASSGRNIFQMGAAPAPAADAKKALAPLPKTTPVIDVKHPAGMASAIAAHATPSAPKMTFHYYGFKVSMASGHKQAFLLDGEDILIAGENDTFKRGRYKVTHIGVNSITIEDLQYKASQTLQLEDIKG